MKREPSEIVQVEYEVVDVQPDTRPWWKDRYLTFDWRVVAMTAVILLPAAVKQLAEL